MMVGSKVKLYSLDLFDLAGKYLPLLALDEQ